MVHRLSVPGGGHDRDLPCPLPQTRSGMDSFAKENELLQVRERTRSRVAIAHANSSDPAASLVCSFIKMFARA
jgi:hypothetical protein